MKKTGLPLAYPNIPQLSSVAATLLAAALPLPALPSHASPGGGREGASLAPQRMAFPFCRGFLGGAFAGARSVPGKDRRAAGSPTPQAWAFPLALPFPECGAQHRACCLPLSTVLCYTWGGGVRYGKVPPHDIRRPPAP